MTQFKRDTLVAASPAYNIHTREVGRSYDDEFEAINLSDSELLIVGNRVFYISSVVGCALEDGRDPIAAHNDAVEKGHEVYWINSRGASITSHKREAVKVIKVVPGETLVRFHGHVFLIETAANDNLQLIKWEG